MPLIFFQVRENFYRTQGSFFVGMSSCSGQHGFTEVLVPSNGKLLGLGPHVCSPVHAVRPSQLGGRTKPGQINKLISETLSGLVVYTFHLLAHICVSYQRVWSRSKDSSLVPNFPRKYSPRSKESLCTAHKSLLLRGEPQYIVRHRAREVEEHQQLAP